MKESANEKKKAIELVAKKIYDTTYNSIMLEMRFMDVALAHLPSEPWSETLATEGAKILYNPLETVKNYQKNPKIIAHDMMHLALHCVFRHLFYAKNFIPLWDLACDVAVEQLIHSLNQPLFDLGSDPKEKLKKEKIAFFESKVQPFTPHNLIAFFQLQNYSPEEIEELESLFQRDDHKLWLQYAHPVKGGDGTTPSQAQSAEKVWQDISKIIEMNMESFQKKQGDKAGNLMQQLKQLNRERYDYSRFLKKFAVMQEAMKVNDDEFDYIFYTYGLNEYGNMPLLEPLEYKDSLLIRDFVIAIDTSGSTSGDVVQTFLQKTYNILKSTETFSEKINLYIIQCDADIQEVKLITDDESFEQYIKTFKIKGLGGTDFRPVFDYVDLLVADKKFQRLKGLIYFTDGYGEFPTKKRDYDTAFVFVVEEDFENITVPPWAIKVLLTEEEVKEI